MWDDLEWGGKIYFGIVYLMVAAKLAAICVGLPLECSITSERKRERYRERQQLLQEVYQKADTDGDSILGDGELIQLAHDLDLINGRVLPVSQLEGVIGSAPVEKYRDYLRQD